MTGDVVQVGGINTINFLLLRNGADGVASTVDMVVANLGEDPGFVDRLIAEILQSGDAVGPAVLEVLRLVAQALPRRSAEKQREVARHERLAEVIGERFDSPDPDQDTTAVPVFPGMRSFRTGQSRRFFGRRALVAAVIHRLAVQREVGEPLFLVGVSGAGKTSLVQAGVVPAVLGGHGMPADTTWDCVVLRPGNDPLATLLATFGAPTDHAAITPGQLDTDRFRLLVRQRARRDAGDPGRVLIVVDQFEEVFAPEVDPEHRARFIAALTAVAADPTRVAAVVLGMRADCYGRCLGMPEFAGVVDNKPVRVERMTTDELRQTVLGPAAAAGLAVEDGFVQRVLDDLGVAGGRYHPGVHPLLAHALEATWLGGDRTSLTIAAYERSGGVREAVVNSAERFYDELRRTPPVGDGAAAPVVLRRILTTLVTPGDPPTGRRVPQGSLVGADDGGGAVLQRLVDARMVTVTESGVEITHDALITAWPRLRGWLDEDPASTRIRDQLITAAEHWSHLGRDAGVLYRGTRLAAARSLSADAGYLASVERDFLAASVAAEEAEQAEERRRVRVLRRATVGLAVFLALAVTAGVVAVVQWRRADENRAAAVSRQYAAQSVSSSAGSPRRAILQALLAWRASPTAEARGALLSAGMLGHAGEFATVGGSSAALSPDGSLAAIGGDGGRLELWRTADHTKLGFDLVGHRTKVTGVDFAPDGSTLASASLDAFGLRIWDVRTGAQLHELPGVRTASWSPDGTTLVAPDDYGHLKVWDTATWAVLREIPIADLTPYQVAYNGRGDLIAVGGADGSVRVWHADGTPAWQRLENGADSVVVAWSPDGTTLASGALAGGRVSFWAAADGKPGPVVEAGAVSAIAYHPDGGHLLVAGGDRSLRQWSLAKQDWEQAAAPVVNGAWALAVSAGTVLAVPLGGHAFLVRTGNWLRQGSPVTSLAFGADGSTVAAGGADGWVRTWDASTHAVRTASTWGSTVVVAPGRDGVLALASDERVRIADTDAEFRFPRRAVAGLVVLPDGRVLTTTSQPLPGVAERAAISLLTPDLDRVVGERRVRRLRLPVPTRDDAERGSGRGGEQDPGARHRGRGHPAERRARVRRRPVGAAPGDPGARSGRRPRRDP